MLREKLDESVVVQRRVSGGRSVIEEEPADQRPSKIALFVLGPHRDVVAIESASRYLGIKTKQVIRRPPRNWKYKKQERGQKKRRTKVSSHSHDHGTCTVSPGSTGTSADTSPPDRTTL